MKHSAAPSAHDTANFGLNPALRRPCERQRSWLQHFDEGPQGSPESRQDRNPAFVKCGRRLRTPPPAPLQGWPLASFPKMRDPNSPPSPQSPLIQAPWLAADCGRRQKFDQKDGAEAPCPAGGARPRFWSAGVVSCSESGREAKSTGCDACFKNSSDKAGKMAFTAASASSAVILN
jgi:hypothetical protein